MDNLAARFRRINKLESPTPSRHESVPTPRDSVAHPVTSDPPPVPRISAITTPPSNIQMPKSPLRSLHSIRMAKRSCGRLSATEQLPAPLFSFPPGLEPVSHNLLHGYADYAGYASNQISPYRRTSNLPSFLAIPDAEMMRRYHEIVWIDRRRTPDEDVPFDPRVHSAPFNDPRARGLDRYSNIQPWADNRVHLQVPEGKLDYINASPIVCKSPIRPTTTPAFHYIAMQGPKASTVEHVWRMVAQLEGPVVMIMLTETYEGLSEKCFPYFPHDPYTNRIEIGETDEFGDGFRGHVECTSLEQHHSGAIQVRKLNLHVDGREDTTIWHLLYRVWPDFGVPKPEDCDAFFQLMALSRELNTNASNPRIVHCSAGVGRTGTFIALETLLRDLDEGAMDNIDECPPSPASCRDVYPEDPIFQVVNSLRQQRRYMVQADVQYAFIYMVLRHRWVERQRDSAGKPAEPERSIKRKQNFIMRSTATPTATPPAATPTASPKTLTSEDTPATPETPLIAPLVTIGQIRATRHIQQSVADNDSSDDSTPGGAPLYYGRT